MNSHSTNQFVSQPDPAPPLRRIVLTGFMGSGKSTVGPLVAQHLGWSFVDVDDVIEDEAKPPSLNSLRATAKLNSGIANTQPLPS